LPPFSSKMEAVLLRAGSSLSDALAGCVIPQVPARLWISPRSEVRLVRAVTVCDEWRCYPRPGHMRSARLFNSLFAAAVLLLAGFSMGAESAEELIQQGNVFYNKLQPAEALKFYLPAEKLDPKNAHLLVRIARQYRHLMSEATKREEKVQFATTAVEYSQRAVALAPNDPETQLALAISQGKLLPFQSNKEQFTNSAVVKTAVDKAIALDPKNDLSWHVLGRWYLNFAEVSAVKRALAKVVYGKLPAATYDDAVRCFEKAIELNPNRLMHYIELGRTCADMGRAEEARKFINHGLAMPNTEKDDPETKERGRQILAKLH
jgi:tetratricopeptide (TPR) repeat protein